MPGVRIAAGTALVVLIAASAAHGVVLSCGTTSASPGDVATVQIVLERTDQEPVAGTQNDLQFDPAIFSPQISGCRLAPAITDKQLDTAVLPSGDAVRAIVVGLNNVDVIAAGELYTCPFLVADDAALGDYQILNTKQIASAPDGSRLPVSGTDCVVSVVPTPTPQCRTDADCPPGEVCVGGKCVVATPTPTPPGFCNDDHDCPLGEICVDHHCVTPTPTPTPMCTTDDDCPSGEVCVNNHCVTPTPKKKGGGGGCNCEIDPGAPAAHASDGLAVVLPALVVLLRWRSRRASG
jgi:MYXO-CTERM domain-containing protein